MTSKLDTAGLERFGIDAVDLDMIKRGDMLGPKLGAKVFAALEALTQQDARIAELERERAADRAVIDVQKQKLDALVSGDKSDVANAYAARVAEIEAHLAAICKAQADNYGDATATHVSLIKPCDEARAALAHKGEGR